MQDQEERALPPEICKVIFNEEQIQEAVARIGEQITRDYAGQKVLLVTVLKGAFIFMADLVRAIKGHVEIDFMAVSSYGSGAKSSGVVRIIKDLNVSVEGRHIIIVEDILDSGLTLKYLLKNLKSRGPLSIEVATLLFKEGKQQTNVHCKYVGLICPDEFVVGYGLDYEENYRNLSYIGVLDPEAYEVF
ncbi:MAG: hypoxanthine phosphoribosyltransferase [Coriobacteriia bacterium]|nr:hypoxanthine phosphoribosyltransferase [Coriobacteriia bacterium]MCL2750531.1 hypoxanthine phosphoribosyltransferase [Coriobacteriia bacterium]